MGEPFDYRALFESAPGLLLVLDREFNIVDATDNYIRVTGLDWRALEGEAYFPVLEREIARRGFGESASLRDSFRRVLDTRRRDEMPVQRFDLPGESGALEERYWSVTNVPILAADGSVNYLVHRVRDITRSLKARNEIESQRRLAQEREDLIDALRAANRELADLERKAGDSARLGRLNTVALMTSAIAHDMSQPLVAASSYITAYSRVNRTSAAVNPELLDKAGDQIRRAGEIVSSLRSFISNGEGRQRAEDAGAMVRHALSLFEPTARRLNVEADCEIAGELPPVHADRTQIEQVLVNLLTNAAEAMGGGATRRAHVAVRRADGVVRIDVRDNGPGLSKDLVAAVFEPFHTSKSHGMGLGLPICREILRAHNGEIWLSANGPDGATFSVTLPCAASG
ncbi:MAG TPA: ATP-binding protein [Rhizomicrobium sp.]|nr:ATP-binding protein [Rhizomicrobium sp.]